MEVTAKALADGKAVEFQGLMKFPPYALAARLASVAHTPQPSRRSSILRSHATRASACWFEFDRDGPYTPLVAERNEI
jgi:hypothetical protein